MIHWQCSHVSVGQIKTDVSEDAHGSQPVDRVFVFVTTHNVSWLYYIMIKPRNYYKAVTQIYGKCISDSSVPYVGDKVKYRKPDPYPRPEWCFCMKRDGGKDVCPQHRNREACLLTVYPNSFDHNSQMCRPGDHQFCQTKDINMFCGAKTMFDPRERFQKNLCECRHDMDFDTKYNIRHETEEEVLTYFLTEIWSAEFTSKSTAQMRRRMKLCWRVILSNWWTDR